MADRTFIYRFSYDLRLDDHAGLAEAASQGAVVPLLVVDSAFESRLRRSPRRAAFACGAVRALAEDLRERGVGLIVRRGDARSIIAALARETGAAGVAWSASCDGAAAARHRELQASLEQEGLAAVFVHDAPVIAPGESAQARSGDGPGYRAFAPYFDVWRQLPIASHEQPLLLRFSDADVESEPLPEPYEFGCSEPAGTEGSAAARQIFDDFLRHRAAQYAVAARVPSDSGTSRLSAHLSFGTISARTVAGAVRRRCDDPLATSEERLSLRLFLRALAQRDFFLQLAWFNPQNDEQPLQVKMRGFAWEPSHRALEAWCTGATGFPLVDAGMRELRETGWMHPLVRAVAASVLCFDLGVDWRIGRDTWDRLLVEDDLALATGNWQWIAGVGADMAQYPRIYNPERQRRRCDPEGTYVRRWVPELRNVPLEAWNAPVGSTAQLPLSLFADGAYPAPAVDHAVAARSFLRRYRDFISA